MSIAALSNWDLPSPYLHTLEVASTEIDSYQHVNNAVYVEWLDRAAWAHSSALGLPVTRCVQLDRGMAVVRTVITYRRAALLGDQVLVATWLLPGDTKMRVRRRFQARRASDGETLVRAEIDYACIELSSGRPARWPAEFHLGYVILPEVLGAQASLTPL
jgi:acyl-CoA thioester hydrolase